MWKVAQIITAAAIFAFQKVTNSLQFVTFWRSAAIMVQLSQKTHLTRRLCFNSQTAVFTSETEVRQQIWGHTLIKAGMPGKNSEDSAAEEETWRWLFALGSPAVGGWLNDGRMQHMQKYQLQCTELELGERRLNCVMIYAYNCRNYR